MIKNRCEENGVQRGASITLATGGNIEGVDDKEGKENTELSREGDVICRSRDVKVAWKCGPPVPGSNPSHSPNLSMTGEYMYSRESIVWINMEMN